jgi:Aldo/keto reductase family
MRDRCHADRIDTVGRSRLHDEGLIEGFGVSNFSAWQVAEASEVAVRHRWIRPSVYQGMYDAITRAVEPGLFKCLGNCGIRFHAYNPLAGRASGKNLGVDDAVVAGSRFDNSHAQQATSRSLLERRLSRCLGGNSPIVRRPWSRCGLRGVALTTPNAMMASSSAPLRWSISGTILRP